MNWSIQRIRSVAVAIVASSIAVACGGGGSDGVDGPAWSVEGRVTDANGGGVADAQVSVVLDKTYATTTDAQGNYALKVPREYAYPDYFSGVVSKAGYVPQPLLMSYANGTLAATSAISTRATTDADLVLASGLNVTHLGDSSYGGAANSQFQMANASGTYWLDRAVLTSAQKTKYRQLCIGFYAKGVQSNSTTQDQVSLSKGGAPGTYLVQPIPATATSGAYSIVSTCFLLDSFAAQDTIQVQINSQQTGPGDYDDFEFVAVTGRFQ